MIILILNLFRMKSLCIACCFSCFIISIPVSVFSQNKQQETSDIPKVILDSMPKIDPWMFENNGSPASWLGFKLNGKTLYEPIDLIIIDTISISGEASATLVEQRFANAGFDERPGHSSNYMGRMNDTNFTQTPDTTSNKAFSNYLWAFTNDHARLFGPYKYNGIYFWIGSVSREMGISHEYVSFKKAVDELERCLVQFASVKSLGKYNLHNAINSDTLTTGDHAGFATVLQLK